MRMVAAAPEWSGRGAECGAGKKKGENFDQRICRSCKEENNRTKYLDERQAPCKQRMKVCLPGSLNKRSSLVGAGGRDSWVLEPFDFLLEVLGDAVNDFI